MREFPFHAAPPPAVPPLLAQAHPLDVDGLVSGLPAWTRQVALAGVAWWQIFGLFGAIFVGLVVRTVVAWIVTTQGQRILRRRGEKANREIVSKAARPIGSIAMAGVLWLVLPALDLGVRANKIGIVAIRVLAATGAIFVVYRLVDVVAEVFARRAARTDTKLDDQLVPLVRKTLKVFVVALGFIFVLQNLDVDVGSLLAGASLGGLAFTLAAKDTVANLFGSVSIFADKPFQIGDWVVIGSVEGIVEEVGMRTTRVRTFYNSLVTIPNSKIADSAVDNYGARVYRRTFVTLGVQYDTTPKQLQAFCDGIRAILQANSFVRQDLYEVHFSGFGDHSLNVMLYFFFKVANWSEELRERHNVFLEVLRLAKELGIAFAFPTQTLHVSSLAEPRAVAAATAPDPAEMTRTVMAFGPGGALARPDGPKVSHGFWPSTVEKPRPAPPEASETVES